MMMNNRPGDWNCRSCFHLNFQRRESCQRCGDPKPVAALLLLQDQYYGTSGGGGGSACFGLRGNSAAAAVGSFSSSSIGPDVRPGDWYCTVGNCDAHNFASRSSCFKCGAFKLDAASLLLDNYNNNNNNSPAFDTDHMYRAAAGRMSPFSPTAFTSAGNTSRSSWKSGDWICTRSGCNEHNFASRMECFRCNAPRIDSTTMSSSYY